MVIRSNLSSESTRIRKKMFPASSFRVRTSNSRDYELPLTVWVSVEEDLLPGPASRHVTVSGVITFFTSLLSVP